MSKPYHLTLFLKTTTRQIFKIILFIFVLIAGQACKKGKIPSPVTPVTPLTKFTGPDVYLTGYQLVSGSTPVATYWKNDTPKYLAAINTKSCANAIFLSGADVYTAGFCYAGTVRKAVYWKNYEMTVLGNGEATGIAVQGADVYISGTEDLSSEQSPTQAVYWKNGVRTQLLNPAEENCCGKPSSWTSAIAVQGTDVHVSGAGNISASGGHRVAIYWKNAKPTLLTPFSQGYGDLNASSIANDLKMQGSDVYIAGYIIPASSFLSSPDDISGAVYWKNGVGIPLIKNSLYSVATDIAVADSKVYASGRTDSWNIFSWSNGATATLNNDMDTYPVGIATYKGDVYVAAFKVGYALVWKNGVLQPDKNTLPSRLTGIAVTDHIK